MAKYNVVTNVDSSSKEDRDEAKEQRMALEAIPACMYCPAAEDLVTHTYMSIDRDNAAVTDEIDEIDAELIALMREFEEAD